MSISRPIHRVLLSFFVLLLAQCTSVTREGPASTHPQVTSPYTLPTSAYLALAQNQTGQEEQSLLIMAAGRAIQDGQLQQGLAILSQTANLSSILNDEKKLLLALVDTIQNRPSAATTQLASLNDVSRLPLYYQVQFHDLLATAYQSLGHTTESVVERIKLDALLSEPRALDSNRRALWLSLTALPNAELNTLAAESTQTTELEGWVQLALIAREKYTNPETLLAHIKQWQQNFPRHPGNHVLSNPLTRVTNQLFPPPSHIALLLPLTGPLAGPGHAIKDGFMAAYDSSHTTDYVQVRTYDTHSASVAGLYDQAIRDGAQYVVGPLLKSDVATIASMSHPVPTLLLNDLDQSTNHNAYQFGLSPRNEAQHIAAKARQQGHLRALIIAPTGSWGDDIVRALSTQWRSSGAQVVDTLRFSTRDNLNHAMRDFLHIASSEIRGKQLQRLLGSRLQVTAARRNDFDVVFMVAYPTQARQIMPLLNYYYAGDVPVYATSTVYSGTLNPSKDRDLDRIIFCDMPWVFTHQAGMSHWPEQLNSYNRLYALGLDSYALSNQLNQLLLFRALGLQEQSGILSLDTTQHIVRIPTFGQFKQGVPYILRD